jgi:UDP-N-acetyl-D-mannosaminuronic acid dehydrogenase
MKKKIVCVVGLGYIGLPTAALLANNGYYVNGVDISKKIISNLKRGKFHITEANLDEFLKLAISNGKLKVFDKPQFSDVYMICVPTPLHENSKIPKPNIDHVLSAARSIASFIKSGDLIILDGFDRLEISGLSVIKRLMNDNTLDLPSGERIVAHPNFRLLAIAIPPTSKNEFRDRYLLSDLPLGLTN